MDGVWVTAARQALVMAVIVAGPPLMAALVVGFTLAVLQAMTQVQDQTVPIVAKIFAVFGTVYVMGTWMALGVYRFAILVFAEWIPRIR